jgi:hypothetical protein
MVPSDRALEAWLIDAGWVHYLASAIGAVLVLAVGAWMRRRSAAEPEPQHQHRP